MTQRHCSGETQDEEGFIVPSGLCHMCGQSNPLHSLQCCDVLSGKQARQCLMAFDVGHML